MSFLILSRKKEVRFVYGCCLVGCNNLFSEQILPHNTFCQILMSTTTELLEVGADVNECIRSYAGQFNESQIRQAVEKLASEGLIYSTINEDNYKYAM
mmetsp:Transcript_28144/g.42102  ORF Transcript_28144/g.42102 Transcript_28144/m.42102 type:complete len:98 (+) Transcript_28144:738-1031(+)